MIPSRTGSATMSDFYVVIYNSPTSQLTGTYPFEWPRFPTYVAAREKRPYWNLLDEKTRSAVAVPPQPPPVPLKLAFHSSRSVAVSTGVSLAAERPIPRRHARQRTCARSRRKIRTWER